MVPNPTNHLESAQLGRRQIRGTLQRYCQKPTATENELNSRPVSRFNQSISVEELNVLTRKMNIKTRTAQAPLLRSHSAPIETTPSSTMTRVVTETHKAYRSYTQSDGSQSSGSSISTSSSLPPPSRYHHTKKFKRRVTFNESVQVFELPPTPPAQEPEKSKTVLPYTKTRMKVKKDTVKFEEIKQIKRPSTRRLQSRMTSYVRDKLKAN